jgi:hypothetical protein
VYERKKIEFLGMYFLVVAASLASCVTAEDLQVLLLLADILASYDTDEIPGRCYCSWLLSWTVFYC